MLLSQNLLLIIVIFNPFKVTKIIPAGKYTSCVSQSDADSKAQNDVNSNKQSYANSQGKCNCAPSGGTLRFYFGTSSGQPSSAKISAEFINTTTGDSEEMIGVEILANSFHSIGLKAGTWQIVMGEIKESSYPNRTGLCTPGCVYSGPPSSVGGRITNVTITDGGTTEVTCQPGWSS